jgi:hypothetical protein
MKKKRVSKEETRFVSPCPIDRLLIRSFPALLTHYAEPHRRRSDPIPPTHGTRVPPAKYSATTSTLFFRPFISLLLSLSV